MSEPDELAAHIERAARQMVTHLVEERDELLAERDGWFRDLEEIAAELESEVDMHGPTHVQLIDLVRGVKDERDRLRAERDHYHRFATMVGEIVRRVSEDIPSIDIETLLRDMPGNIAAIRDERDRLRKAIDADRPFQLAAMRVLTDERDRLRALVDDSDGPVAKTMEYLGQAEGERDRLRVVVDGLRGYLWLQDVGEEPSEVTAVFSDLRAILAEFDGSPEPTDGPPSGAGPALDGSGEATDG